MHISSVTPEAVETPERASLAISSSSSGAAASYKTPSKAISSMDEASSESAASSAAFPEALLRKPVSVAYTRPPASKTPSAANKDAMTIQAANLFLFMIPFLSFDRSENRALIDLIDP